MAWLPLPPRKYRWVLGACGLALVGLAVSAVWGELGLNRLRELRRRQAQLEQRAFELQQENLFLRRHMERLARDDAYLERVVRERLGWIRPGERVYRFGSTAATGSDVGSERTRPRIGANTTPSASLR